MLHQREEAGLQAVRGGPAKALGTESWLELGGRLVSVKNVPPGGAPGDSLQDASFFSLFAPLKNKLFLLF